VFGAILDADRGGYWRIAPGGGAVSSRQLYLPDTNVLLTRFSGSGGVAEVADFMPVSTAEPYRPQLIRRVTAVKGTVPLVVDLQPRFDYGRARHTLTVHDTGATFRLPGPVPCPGRCCSA
jgi:GH15 family glucan-1,4-alpha-glucosidase